MQHNEQVSRKKFISWGLGITAILAIPAFLRPVKKIKKTNTVKMLTQDGRLVCIDETFIPTKKKKIDPKEIHTWISKKKTSL